MYILVFHKEHKIADHTELNEDRDLCARVRKAYRPETFVGTILSSSLKYRPTPGMLRSLVGHSCDFQWAHQITTSEFAFLGLCRGYGAVCF